MSQVSTSVKQTTIDRARQIQQREQLRQTLIHKFHQDYAKGNAKLQDVVTKIVTDYFHNEKVTEQSLKLLRQKIIDAVSNCKSNKSQINNESKQEQQVEDKEDKKSVARSVRSQRSQKDQQPTNLPPAQRQVDYQDDQRSVASSNLSQKNGPKSVYMPDEEDEWTALVKFDTELFKKEQELELQRKHEFKRKMKQELDRQLDEKQRKTHEEKHEEQAYVQLTEHQMKVYDQREEDKKRQQLQKQRQQKAQRDKQVHDEERRKALERKKERELDNLLVRRIQEEISIEQRDQMERKNKEKDRLQSMIHENGRNKQVFEEQTQMEKQMEVDMQKKYTNLLDQLEAQRENEKKEREEKIKKIMGTYAQSVVKDQKEMIKQEDNKLLTAMITQSQLEQQEEEKKKHHIKLQKLEMRGYLNQQIEDKRRRKEEEQQLDKKQAEVWQQDLQNYTVHESKKNSYIKNVNLRHQDILKQQMDDRQSRVKDKFHRMTADELMHNKNLLKEIADNQDQIKMKKVIIGKDI